MSWSYEQITVAHWDLEGDDDEGYVITFEFETPSGVILFMANVDTDEERSILILSKAHIEGPGAHSVGIANLRALIEFVRERSGYARLKIEGATRTTGAQPGRQPPDLWFPRRDRDAPEE
jgi:hypothetical protein